MIYGLWCLVNHYGSLPPHTRWRSDLSCLCGLELQRQSGQLLCLRLQPYQLRGFQLREPSAADRQLLERQMGLDLAPSGWRCQRQDGGWFLLPG